MLNTSNILICAVVAAIVFVAVDAFGGSYTEPETGWVADRQYVPEQTIVRTETDANGNIRVVTDTDPEKWLVIVTLPKQAVTVNTSREIWNRASKDAMVKVDYRKGWLSGGNYGYRIISISGGGSSGGSGAGASF